MKAYIALFYLDVGPVPPSDVSGYMEAFRNAMNFHELEDCLNAQVLTYTIPLMSGPTRIEILEFFVDEETQPHNKNSFDITGKTPNEIAQILTKVLTDTPK